MVDEVEEPVGDDGPPTPTPPGRRSVGVLLLITLVLIGWGAVLEPAGLPDPPGTNALLAVVVVVLGYSTRYAFGLGGRLTLALLGLSTLGVVLATGTLLTRRVFPTMIGPWSDTHLVFAAVATALPLLALVVHARRGR